MVCSALYGEQAATKVQTGQKLTVNTGTMPESRFLRLSVQSPVEKIKSELGLSMCVEVCNPNFSGRNV